MAESKNSGKTLKAVAAGCSRCHCANKSKQELDGGQQLVKYVDVAALHIVIVVVLQAFTMYLPLVPLVAEEKCSNKTESGLAIGFLLGVPPLVMFISSPLFGRGMRSAGARMVFALGIVVISGCSLLVGFADRLSNWRDFLLFSCAVSVVFGVGVAALLTSSFCLLAHRFPNSPGVVASVVEVLTGTAYAFGPAIGGVLWHAGHNRLLLTGIVAVTTSLAALALFCVLSGIVVHTEANRNQPDSQTSGRVDDVTMKDILTMPRNWMILLLGTFAQTSLAILLPSLSLFMKKQFHVHDSQVGLGLMTNNLGYVLGALCFGYLVDTFGTRSIIAIGLSVSALGSFLMGPARILGLKPSLPLFFIGVAMEGVGASAMFVPVSKYLLDTMELSGFRRTDHLLNLIAGLQKACIGLGLFIGPSIGGGLTAAVGFQNVSTLIAFSSLTFLGAFCMAVLCEHDSPLKSCLLTCVTTSLQKFPEKERASREERYETVALTNDEQSE